MADIPYLHAYTWAHLPVTVCEWNYWTNCPHIPSVRGKHCVCSLPSFSMLTSHNPIRHLQLPSHPLSQIHITYTFARSQLQPWPANSPLLSPFIFATSDWHGLTVQGLQLPMEKGPESLAFQKIQSYGSSFPMPAKALLYSRKIVHLLTSRCRWLWIYPRVWRSHRNHYSNVRWNSHRRRPEVEDQGECWVPGTTFCNKSVFRTEPGGIGPMCACSGNRPGKEMLDASSETILLRSHNVQACAAAGGRTAERRVPGPPEPHRNKNTGKTIEPRWSPDPRWVGPFCFFGLWGWVDLFLFFWGRHGSPFFVLFSCFGGWFFGFCFPVFVVFLVSNGDEVRTDERLFLPEFGLKVLLHYVPYNNIAYKYTVVLQSKAQSLLCFPCYHTI